MKLNSEGGFVRRCSDVNSKNKDDDSPAELLNINHDLISVCIELNKELSIRKADVHYGSPISRRTNCQPLNLPIKSIEFSEHKARFHKMWNSNIHVLIN